MNALSFQLMIAVAISFSLVFFQNCNEGFKPLAPVEKTSTGTPPGTGGPIVPTVTAPAITTPLAALTVNAGTSLIAGQFCVTVTGTDPLTYSWTKSGVPAQYNANKRCYITTALTANDSGTYKVTVTNSAGSVSSQATLTVNPVVVTPTVTAPAITTPLAALTVNAGTSLIAGQFCVTVTGTDPLTYSWTKSGVPAQYNANKRCYITTAPLTTSDSGMYTVTVTNSAGSASSTAMLTVTAQAPDVKRPHSWTGTFEPIIDESENLGMSLIPNYTESSANGKLCVVSRYIGTNTTASISNLANSGIATNNGKTEAVINTKDLEARGLYTPITGGGPHVWVAKNITSTAVYPWQKINQDLALQARVSVPVVELTDPQGNKATSNFTSAQAPVTQVSFGFYLRDETTGKTVAYVVPMYESRGTYLYNIANDTQVYFASVPLEDNQPFITKSPYSDSLQWLPYTTEKFFRVHITEEDLLEAIRAFNANGVALSEDVTKYRLTQSGVLFELPNYVKNGHNTSAVTISWFSAHIYKF